MQIFPYTYISTCKEHKYMNALINISMCTYVCLHINIPTHTYNHACLATYISTKMHTSLPTKIYTFRIQYFQMSGISILVNFHISGNMETLKFPYFCKSRNSQNLKILSSGNTEIRNCAILYNSTLVATFIFGQIFTGHIYFPLPF